MLAGRAFGEGQGNLRFGAVAGRESFPLRQSLRALWGDRAPQGPSRAPSVGPGGVRQSRSELACGLESLAFQP
jgi:hypothetical protein